MEYRLLGPLEVRADGEPLPLGGGKRRGVLALLLLHPNEVVSFDRLIDELWGARPPKTVEAYIQNCVSRLRGVLGQRSIETRPPGYSLHVDPEDIDAHRFERAVEHAPRLDPPERAAALREALALWRGPPLADLVFEGAARIEVARLDELRLTALEIRLEAELELGRHGVLLAEIEALAGRHPGRERLRYLQMLALYRAGRQREALRAYQEARVELIEQFGLEPGEPLRALERMIISHDPSLELVARTSEERSEPEQQRNVIVLLAELVVGENLADDSANLRIATALAEIALTVERHGGVLHELLPDDVAAIFGAPRSHDDDAMRALRAATEFRRSLPEGISARMAVERVAGNAIDNARPLLEAAAPGDLLLGPAVLRLVPRAVDVVPHGPDGCFRLLRFDADADPILRNLDTPFIGRRIELEHLRTELAQVVNDRAPGHVALIGEAGIGKTRLVREFLVDALPNLVVVTARCAAYGEGANLLLLRDILAQVGPAETVLAHRADADRVIAQLSEPSLAEKSEVFWALRRLLEEAAQERPVVLVLDDVHRAGPTFLDLVEYLAGWTAAPLLVISLTRPELLEVRPEWSQNAVFLGPLAPMDARELAVALQSESDLASPALEAALDTAGGNPLFLEQLLAAGAEGSLGAVPPTVEVLIESRLDRLPRDEHRVLERASVAGRGFWRAAVEAASPEDERASVSAALMALVRRRLIRPERSALPGEDGFCFHHILIRDVVYACIAEETRAVLHQSIARSLDGREHDLDELVGYHLEQAALLHSRSGTAAPSIAEEAGLRLGRAGLRALKRVDGLAGVDLLTRATALLPDDAARLELDWGLATSIKFSGDGALADQRLEDVAEKAERLGDDRIELRARIEQVWLRLEQSRLSVDDALALLARAISVFEAASDDLGLGRAWDLTYAINGVYQYRWAPAERAAVRGRLHYGRGGFSGGVPLVRLAVAAHRGPTPAREAIGRCEALLAAAPTPVWESFILPFLAAVEAMDGRFASARAHLEEARVGRQQFGDKGTIATSWSAIAAEVELLAADPVRAEAILLTSCEALAAAGGGEWLATNTAMLGEALYRQSRFAEALSSSRVALRIAPAAHLTSRSVARRVQAKALAQLGEHGDATKLATESLRLLEDTDVLDERGETLLASAEVRALAGLDANEQWDEALATFARKGNVVSAERVRTAMSVVG